MNLADCGAGRSLKDFQKYDKILMESAEINSTKHGGIRERRSVSGHRDSDCSSKSDADFASHLQLNLNRRRRKTAPDIRIFTFNAATTLLAFYVLCWMIQSDCRVEGKRFASFRFFWSCYGWSWISTKSLFPHARNSRYRFLPGSFLGLWDMSVGSLSLCAEYCHPPVKLPSNTAPPRLFETVNTTHE